MSCICKLCNPNPTKLDFLMRDLGECLTFERGMTSGNLLSASLDEKRARALIEAFLEPPSCPNCQTLEAALRRAARDYNFREEERFGITGQGSEWLNKADEERIAGWLRDPQDSGHDWEGK